MSTRSAAAQYLRSRQSSKSRFVRVTVLLLVLVQFPASNFIGYTGSGSISGETPEFYGTWMQILVGAALLPIVAAFAFIALSERGGSYSFTYAYGDFSQIKQDSSA